MRLLIAAVLLLTSSCFFDPCSLPIAVLCPGNMHEVTKSFCEETEFECDTSLHSCSGSTVYCAQICDSDENVAYESDGTCVVEACRSVTAQGTSFYCSPVTLLEDAGIED